MSVHAKRDPIIPKLAPAAITFAKFPDLSMPPSHIIIISSNPFLSNHSLTSHTADN